MAELNVNEMVITENAKIEMNPAAEERLNLAAAVRFRRTECSFRCCLASAIAIAPFIIFYVRHRILFMQPVAMQRPSRNRLSEGFYGRQRFSSYVCLR